jgi:prolipoprotein diacylglyceryl transferase
MDSFIVWDASRVIFEIPVLGFPIRWYSLLFAGGLIGAYYILRAMFIAENKSLEALDALPTYIVLATLIGARLGHTLFYEPERYLSNPLEILMVWKGGLASHGGFIAVIIAFYLYAKKYREHFSLFWILDRAAIAAMFSSACIRVGNFFNSEIIGLKTDVPWAVIFKNNDLIPRHPAQLYEAFGYFWLCIIFYLLYRKLNRKVPEGMIFGSILVLGMGYRLFIEQFKENQVAFEQTMALNMGQILSIPFILAGIYFALCLHHKSHHKSNFWAWSLGKKK